MAPKTVHEIRVGDRARLIRRVTEADLLLFAAATGDTNPVHFDPEYAAATRFRGRIAHGILAAGFISAAIAGDLPGPGTVYVSQTLRFRAPVRVGDEITAEVEVIRVDPEKNRVCLRTVCRNQEGVTVLDGEAVVVPPAVRDGAGELEAVEARRQVLEARLETLRRSASTD